MKTELVLTVTIRYETNGTPVLWLREQLRQVAVRASGDGAFTGSSEAEVESWKVTVHQTEKRRA